MFMRKIISIIIFIILTGLLTCYGVFSQETSQDNLNLTVITTSDVPADGTSKVDIHIQVSDMEGAVLTDGLPVTLSVTAGEILTEDKDPETEGVQNLTAGGISSFTILAPLEPGESLLQISCGTAFTEKKINFIDPHINTAPPEEENKTEEVSTDNKETEEISKWKESLPAREEHPENVEILSPQYGTIYPYNYIRVTVRGVSGQQVGLWVNDVLFAEHVMDDTGLYTFNNVPLVKGQNKLVAQAMFDGETAEDTVLINMSDVILSEAESQINVTSPENNNGGPVSPETTPAPQEKTLKIISPENNSTTETGSIKVTVEGKAGTTVTLLANGKEYLTQNTDETGKVDFLGVPLEEGPNEIKVTSGEIIDTMKVFLVGPIAKIEMSPSENSIPADSGSYIVFRLRVTDAWGKAVRHGSTITIEAGDGTILPEDADPVNKGHQICVDKGFAEFTLVSGDNPGKVTVKAFKTDVEALQEVEFTTPLRDFILVGHAGGKFGYNEVAGKLQPIELDDEFEEELYSDGGITLFLKGKILGKYLLTMSYDSDKDPEERMFKDINPDDFYPIYGDTSTVVYEAQSADKLYIAIQHGTSYLKYSDFHTDFKETETAAFDRTLTGLNFFHETDRYRIRTFAAETKNAFTRDEIRGQGISGYYRLSLAPVVVNSEQIYLETRDRYNIDMVINSVSLSRYVDYDIDYNAGTILFRQPVFSEDNNGNPIFIIATYEGFASNDEKLVYGVRGTLNLDPFEIGATYVNEETSMGNRIMTGGDFRLNIAEGVRLRGEYTHSDTPQGKDNAYLMELDGRTDSVDFNLYYRKIGSGFDNPNISFIQRRTEKYGAKFTARLGETSAFTTEYYNLTDLNRGLKTDYFSARYTMVKDRLDLEAGYEYRNDDDTINLRENKVNIALIKLGYKLRDDLYIYAQREENLSSEDNDLRFSRPDRTILGLEYAINERLTFFARDEIYSQSGEAVNDILVGFTSQISDNTSLFGRYRVGGSINGARNQLSYGLNNQFKLSDSVRANFSFERNQALGIDDVGNSNYTAVTTSFEYLPERPFKAMFKYEIRFTGDSTEHLINLAADGRLGDDWSLYAEHIQYIDNNDGLRRPVNFISRRTLLGFAYRPVEYDWLNILGKLEIKERKNDSAFADSTSEITIGSISAVLEPTRKLELYTQYSFRNVTTKGLLDVSSHTHMFLGRLTYDITNRWDIAAEYRSVWQTETETVIDAAALEVGYMIFGDIRLSAGYAFTGFYDEDFGADNFHHKGPYIGLNIKFSENEQPFHIFDNEVVEKGRREKVRETLSIRTGGLRI